MTSKTKKTTTPEIVVAIEAHAKANYEAGWDQWVETMDVADKEAVVKGCRTEKSGLAKAAKWSKTANEAAAIGAENSALYDADQEAYDRYQAIGKLSVAALINGEAPTKKGGSVISPQQKAAYGKEANNGDQFAKALKDAVIDVDSLLLVATENGIDGSRWDHLNFGMQRMNLGNVLRGMVKQNEEPVSINGVNVS